MAGQGVTAGLLNDATFQIFLGCAILSMLTAPIMIQSSHEASHWITSFFPGAEQKQEDVERGMEGHVIIAGYGLSGKNLAKVLIETNIPYIVVDLNADNITQAKAAEIPAIFGDITRKDILLKAGIRKAKVVVLAISDPIAVRRALAMAREYLNRSLKFHWDNLICF